MTIKFSAHSCGNLLVGGNSITDRQRERIAELLARQNAEVGKPLTAKMQAELEELTDKRDQQFEFGASAISYIRECWRRDKYDYVEPLMTPPLMKGLLCEDQAIGVLSRQVDGPFRVKNEEEFTNDWFVGTPDVVTDTHVEDVKCSWTLRTYDEVEHPSAIYYAQLQAYMDLTGRDKARLCHCLVETPFELVQDEMKRFFWQFGCDEENPHLQECYRKTERMHDISRIPEHDRIKVFEFEYSETYMMRLRKRVEQAREVYATLTLGG